MTIRDYVKKRTQWAILLAAAAVIFYVALPIDSIVASMQRTGVPIPMVACILVILAALQVPSLVKCPRCATRFGSAAMKIGAPLWRAQVNFCPHCGVSLDQPYAGRI